MPKGIPEPWNRCQGRNKQGKQCGRSKSPGTDYCYFHNGWTPTTQKAAAERIRRIELGMDPSVSPREAHDLLKRYYAAQNRQVEHRMKKADPEMYEAWKAAGEQIAKESSLAQEALAQRLGPERIAELQKEGRDVQVWLQSGRVGPRPGSPEFWGEEPEAEAEAEHHEERTPFQRSLDKFDTAKGFTPTQGTNEEPVDPHAEARRLGLLPPREPEEPENQGLLRYPVAARREARRRAYAERHAQRLAQAETERLPETPDGLGGGRVHSDVAPIPAAEFEAQHRSPVSTGPIPYRVGGDIDWADLIGYHDRREIPFIPYGDDGSFEAF